MTFRTFPGAIWDRGQMEEDNWGHKSFPNGREVPVLFREWENGNIDRLENGRWVSHYVAPQPDPHPEVTSVFRQMLANGAPE